MATKIGFKAQPLIDSGGVDWLSVGRDVVKTLTDQEKAREEKRQKGEQAYRDEIKRLGSVELGKDALANQWIMNTVDSITGTAGIDQKLWKSGALSTKDYLRNKANRKNGTDLVLQSYNTYNKNYNEVMDGIANGTLAKEKMLFLRAQAESMFDFEKTGVIVNPETSEVSVAKKDLVDGVYVMSENPNEFLNASELLQASSALYTAFDADKAASDLAKDVAQTVLRTVGGTDIEQAYKALYNAPKGTQDKLDQARKDQIRAILNSEDSGAFLTDYLNEGFSFTKDSDEAATKNEKMSKMILLNQDGSTSLTDEQLNYAVDKFDGILEAYLPKKQKAPLAPKPSGLTATERTAQQEGEIGFGLALDLTSGGSIAGESLEKIKANNNAIDNVYETETSYVIQYKDGSEDKTINKIMRDGAEAREETAVSLMAAVNPNYDATKAETSKQRYLNTNTIGERKEKGLFGERTAISSQNTSTYQTKSEVAKGDKGVSVSQQIKNLPTPDEDNAGQVLDVIKDIYPLPGTESFINQIQVTGVGTGNQDVLNFKLPPEFIPFVQDLSGVTMGEGNNIQIDYDADKDKATLTSVIDGIIAGMYDIYNKSDARNRTEDTSSVTATTTGTTAQGNLDVFGNPK